MLLQRRRPGANDSDLGHEVHGGTRTGWTASRCSADPEVDPALQAEGLSAELSLCTLDRRVRLIPCGKLSSAGGLWAERCRLVDDVMVEPEARKRAGGAIPRLASASILWPLAQRCDQAVWTALDRPAAENVSHLVVLTPQIGDRILDPISLRPNLVWIAELALLAAVGGKISQRAVIYLDRGVEDCASSC